MSWLELLTAAQRLQLLRLPSTVRELQELFTFSPGDLDLVRSHRTDRNRIGFAVQLCFLKYPGWAWTPEHEIPPALLRFIASQIEVSPLTFNGYAERDETRREHLSEIQQAYGLDSFSRSHYKALVSWLREQARGTDQGMALITILINEIRRRRVVVPILTVLERLTRVARALARRDCYRALSTELSLDQIKSLNELLLPKEEQRQTVLGWVRQPLGAPNAANILEAIKRLRFLRQLAIPIEWALKVHQNRLVQIAREGANTDVAHLRVFGSSRRYATLVAIVLDTLATLTDEILEMNERFLGRQFNRAKRKHDAVFHENGRAINDKVRLYSIVGHILIEAKERAVDPFEELEKQIPWEKFKQSVEDAGNLAQSEEFDFLARVGDGYSQIRRYAPEFLEAFDFRSAPASEELITAVNLLKQLNATNARKVPDNAPMGFVKQRWGKLVSCEGGIDRRYYEICVLSELKNALRSGDMWVSGSRRYKDFEEYLLPAATFRRLKDENLGLAVGGDGETNLKERLARLRDELTSVEKLAAMGKLPDASIDDGRLKITPLDNQEPEEAELLNREAYALLPRIKITDLLVEVDEWTGFTKHFTHLRSGDIAQERELLLASILADGINLGVTRMADACPGASAAKLSRIAMWHIREDTYSKALADIVNQHHKLDFAGLWGDGTTSSSDGQRFRTGGYGNAQGQVNAKYGSDPGVTFYTHISDQYSPFYAKLINSTVRDATHVLDGLLYHETELQIEEHYTDTAGFTDHVFALCHLLGFRFAPRIRNLADTNLYSDEKSATYPSLHKMIGAAINTKLIIAHWDAILRLAASIKQGTVTASLILRKLGGYPRQNGLALALRELGRLERTLFILEYVQDLELRRRIHVGLNKGEARNSLARAVFFNRLGELRDRTYENQQHRASGLNLVVAAIVLWNSVYLDQATSLLREHRRTVPDELLEHLSPLRWEHINLTGDYHWKRDGGLNNHRLRPLRTTALRPLAYNN